jgi:acyl-CoA thioesterase FadM
MLFWMRLFKAKLFAGLGSKVSPLQSVALRFRVGWSETLLGVTINSRYLDYMEVGRVAWMENLGLFKLARTEKWLPLVASQTITYKRPLRRWQAAVLDTRLVCWDERWLYCEHVFKRGDKVMASAVSRACVRSKEGLVPPSTVLTKLGHSLPSPDMPSGIAQWVAAEKQLY